MDNENTNNNNNEENIFFLLNKKGIRLNLPKRSDKQWVEETFIDSKAVCREDLNNNFVGLLLSPRKINIFLGIILLVIFFIFGRAFYLQIINGSKYQTLAENNRIRIYHQPAPRGLIYDRHGVPLVKNIPSFSLSIIPVDFPKEQDEKQKLYQEIINLVPENEKLHNNFQKVMQITNKQKDYYQEQILLEDLDYEVAIKLQLLSEKFSGVNVVIRHKRNYLMAVSSHPEYLNNSLSHILGYVGKINEAEFDNLSNQYLYNDIIGKTGVEKNYESELRGVYGIKQVEVDSLGKEKKIIAQEPIKSGNNLILTIDWKMQEKLESLLIQYMQKSNKTKGVAIAQDPRNGEMLALVSLPSYNNNIFSQTLSEQQVNDLYNHQAFPLFFRAISGEYPSGSTIKPVMAAAALQEKIISATTSFISVGGIRIAEWFFPDWQAGGHGITDVRKALAQSVNTFFYIIGGGYNDFVGLGVDKIKKYAEMFGLSQKTGIDLPGEKSGFVPDENWKQETKGERWYIGDTYHLAIGQGDLLVTPLQVANYTSFFANRGNLYQPHVVKEIIDSVSGAKKEILPTVMNSGFIDSYNIDVVRQGMRQGVTSGSARYLNSLAIAVAGKTGTAQWGTDKDPHAWFTSFAPYDNPEIVLTILIEEGEEGSRDPVRIAYDFYQWYYQYMRTNALNK